MKRVIKSSEYTEKDPELVGTGYLEEENSTYDRYSYKGYEIDVNQEPATEGAAKGRYQYTIIYNSTMDEDVSPDDILDSNWYGQPTYNSALHQAVEFIDVYGGRA